MILNTKFGYKTWYHYTIIDNVAQKFKLMEMVLLREKFKIQIIKNR